MFAKIVVAYDGSKYSDRSIAAGIEIAKKFDSSLTILTIAPVLPEVGEAVGMSEKAEKREVEAYRSMAEKAVAAARAAGISKVTFELREGGIAEQLLGFLKGSKADLVIVGSRGQSTFRDLLLGSVAEAVIHHSPCQVLVHR